MVKKFLKRVLPEKLIWKLNAMFPAKPFLSDISNTERIVEYAWAIQQLPKEGYILDVGCSGSMFPKMLASLGYSVIGADMRDSKIEHPNFIFYHGNVCDFIGCKFDAITCISTLEHTALREGEYERTIKKLKEMLKPNGVILITVACGVPAMLNGYRVFGVDEFENAEYFKGVRKGIWVKSSKREVSKVVMKNKDEVKAIVCAIIKKGE